MVNGNKHNDERITIKESVAGVWNQHYKVHADEKR